MSNTILTIGIARVQYNENLKNNRTNYSLTIKTYHFRGIYKSTYSPASFCILFFLTLSTNFRKTSTTRRTTITKTEMYRVRVELF